MDILIELGVGTVVEVELFLSYNAHLNRYFIISPSELVIIPNVVEHV